MVDMESCFITGFCENRFLFMKILLTEEDYICNKIFSFNKNDKISIHSIINRENTAFLANSYNNKTYKYDFDLNEFSEVTVGRDPRHMCLSKDNLYVTNFESDNISVIDLENYILAESIPAGIKPHDIIYSEKRDSIYISCYEENEIIEYKIKYGEMLHYKTNGKPMHIFLFNDQLIVMTYFVNGSIHTKINFLNIYSREIVDVLIIEGLASDFDLDYENDLLYMINIVDKKIYIVDINKKNILKKIFLGGYPESLSIGNESVLVTNSKKNLITLIDKKSQTAKQNINLSFTPYCIKSIN